MTRRKRVSVAEPPGSAGGFDVVCAATPNPAVVFDQLRAQLDDEHVGDGMPYDRNRVVAKLRFFTEQSGRAMLEMGACLIQMKAHEPHGTFCALVEEVTGLSADHARVIMNTAEKVRLLSLKGKQRTFWDLPPSKLFILMRETLEDLETIADGGEVAGVTSDSLVSLSVRELREKFRSAKTQAEARQRIIDKQQEQIRDLQDKLSQPFKPTPGVAACTREEADRLKELNQYVADAETAIAQLIAFTDQVIDREWIALAARQGVERVTLRVAELADRHNLAGAARSA